MVIKSIIGAACTCLLVVSFNANASIISVDWKVSDDNSITRDTTSGLDWLDLTETSNRSYNDVSTKFGAGEEFDGWRYANTDEISRFWDSFGGNSAFYNGWSTANNGLFDSIAPFWGDLRCEEIGCDPGDGYSKIITADEPIIGTHVLAYLYDPIDQEFAVTNDFIDIKWTNILGSAFEIHAGSALVRDVSSVPIPTAVWLFGSGLIGLIGIARRKKT